MDNTWRTSLAHDSRQKIVRRIVDTLQRYMPDAGQDGVDELLKIACRFEEKIFQVATDQQDYLRQISLKMLSLETKANGNPIQGRPLTGAQAAPQAALNPVDPGVDAMPPTSGLAQSTGSIASTIFAGATLPQQPTGLRNDHTKLHVVEEVLHTSQEGTELTVEFTPNCNEKDMRRINTGMTSLSLRNARGIP